MVTPLKAAGQHGLALFFVDFRDRDLARAATSAVRDSASSASGLKSSPVHSVSFGASRWRSTKNCLLACAHHSAAVIGPGPREGSYSPL